MSPRKGGSSMCSRDRLLIVTSDSVPDRQLSLIGPVTSACCISKCALADVLANIKNWSIGGELTSYSEMLDRAAQTVLDRIGERAEALDADAVIGFRLVTSSVASGAAELIGYGTAVRFTS